MKLVIVNESVALSGSGKVTGIIFWKTNGLNFPDAEWNDFVVIILTWWIRALNRLILKESEFEMMDFMDGPFSIRCTRRSNSVLCECIDRRAGERVVEAQSVELNIIASEILGIAKQVSRECYVRGINDTDVHSLNIALRRLQKIMTV